MATKNKTVQTRVTPEVYDVLNKIAECYDITVYSLIANIINNYIKRLEINKNASKPPTTHIDVSVLVNDYICEWLCEVATKNKCNVQDVVLQCIMYTMKQ